MQRVLLFVCCSLFLAAHTSTASPDDGCTPTRSSYPPGHAQVLTLMAAGSLIPEARPIVVTSLGSDWELTDARNHARRLPAGALASGVEALCKWLRSHSGRPDEPSRWNLEEWVSAYWTVETLSWLLDVEPLGSAVALLPATRHLFPRDPAFIAAQGPRAGESLSSAENSTLKLNLTTHLAGFDAAQRPVLVSALLSRGMESRKGMVVTQ